MVAAKRVLAKGSDGYFSNLWNDMSNYNLGNHVADTWNDWLDHPGHFFCNVANNVGSLYVSVINLINADAWVDTYHQEVHYWNSSSADRAHMNAGWINNGLTGVATFGPASELSGFAAVGTENVFNMGLNGGYGYQFGISNYNLRLVHGYDSDIGMTMFSIKEDATGGNMMRFDYGRDHVLKEQINFHSTFRFNINGSTYGSSGQYPIWAPFVYWKYKRK